MAKRSKPQPLSEAQLEIMNVVWDAGEVSVADVWKTLCERRKVARNTVPTMMTRLEERGWLQHRVEGNAFLYTAAVPRAATLRHLVQRLLDTAFSGSAEGLVLAMLEGRGLSKREAERIRKMIREAERRRLRTASIAGA